MDSGRCRLRRPCSQHGQQLGRPRHRTRQHRRNQARPLTGRSRNTVPACPNALAATAGRLLSRRTGRFGDDPLVFARCSFRTRDDQSSSAPPGSRIGDFAEAVPEGDRVPLRPRSLAATLLADGPTCSVSAPSGSGSAGVGLLIATAKRTAMLVQSPAAAIDRRREAAPSRRMGVTHDPSPSTLTRWLRSPLVPKRPEVAVSPWLG